MRNPQSQERGGMKPPFLAVLSLALLTTSGATLVAQNPEAALGLDAPEHGCSVLYATDGVSMLGGNNEDYLNPRTKVWFIPGENGAFGRVYFGFDDCHAQGGMNDQGLFFDGLSIEGIHPVETAGKEESPGNLVDKIMCECATVDCAIRQFEEYFSSEFWFWQFLFGDATGESAIIEPREIIRQKGAYQVATNFLQSATPPERRTDSRYRIGSARLADIDSLPVNTIREVLDAMHAGGPSYMLYSNVYDLNERVVYLYHFHNYEDVVVLALDAELANGYRVEDLPALFPPNPEADQWAKQRLQMRADLMESRRDTDLAGEALHAYAGLYEMPEGWGAPIRR
jgi:hypothetical protein